MHYRLADRCSGMLMAVVPLENHLLCVIIIPIIYLSITKDHVNLSMDLILYDSCCITGELTLVKKLKLYRNGLTTIQKNYIDLNGVKQL